jgi:hypothetical protein
LPANFDNKYFFSHFKEWVLSSYTAATEKRPKGFFPKPIRTVFAVTIADAALPVTVLAGILNGRGMMEVSLIGLHELLLLLLLLLLPLASAVVPAGAMVVAPPIGSSSRLLLLLLLLGSAREASAVDAFVRTPFRKGAIGAGGRAATAAIGAGGGNMWGGIIGLLLNNE